MKKQTIAAIVSMIVIGGVSLAASPPELINYQGVLRDSSGNPLDGEYDMVFRFYDAEVGGSLLLTDEHLASGTGAVVVENGLFTVLLGSGNLVSGVYSTLSEMFANEATVYLEQEVDGEVLLPRIQLVSVPYALNADTLDGNDSTDFAAAIHGHQGSDIAGPVANATNADLLDGNDSSYFLDTSSSAQTKDGPLTVDAVGSAGVGVTGYGDSAGGSFTDSSGNNYADVGDAGGYGIVATGTQAGGYFTEPSGSAYAYVGYKDPTADPSEEYCGIAAYGAAAGGYFRNTLSGNAAALALNTTGVWGSGDVAGGSFRNTLSGNEAALALNSEGVWGSGDDAGGYFESKSPDSGWGVKGEGGTGGGQFAQSDWNAWAELGSNEWGINAHGVAGGGSFRAMGGTGAADLAQPNIGITAWGMDKGGFFMDTDGASPPTSTAQIAVGGLGISALGDTAGGWFRSGGAEAYAGYGTRGVLARASFAGGDFEDSDNGTWARVASETYKINGTGTVNFVQNHPGNPGQVIVYSAPEGDEVATYTRGTARLVDGEARLMLGETFKWVTNPDLGLTAHLTPRGEWSDLFVESLTTEELVVRSTGIGGRDAEFDYIVFGLRIGFEEVSIVQDKTREAYIPSMKDHRELFAQRPELRQYNALARFERMRLDRGLTGESDLTASAALKAAIGEYDPAIHGSIQAERQVPDVPRPELVRPNSIPERPGRETTGRKLDVSVPGRRGGVRSAAPPADEDGIIYAKSFRPSATDLASLVSVAEPVTTGDVLVIDPEQQSGFVIARSAGDHRVFGIVAGEPGVVLGAGSPLDESSEEVSALVPESDVESDEGEVEVVTGTVQVPVAVSGMVFCKVDAGYGAIQPGDLLTTSATPGHAMIANEPQPGTILGKALEPLDVGTGLIRVLVMLR